MTKDQILAEVKTLPPEDREALAEEILQTLPESDQASIDAAWLREVYRREEEYQRSGANSSPVDEVVARVISRARS